MLLVGVYLVRAELELLSEMGETGERLPCPSVVDGEKPYTRLSEPSESSAWDE